MAPRRKAIAVEAETPIATFEEVKPAPRKSRATAEKTVEYTIVENPNPVIFSMAVDESFIPLADRTGSLLLQPYAKMVLPNPDKWKANLRFQEMLEMGFIKTYETTTLPRMNRSPLPQEDAGMDTIEIEKAWQMTEVEDFAEFKRFVELKPRDGRIDSVGYKDGLGPQAKKFLIEVYKPRLRASMHFEMMGKNRQERVQLYVKRIQYIEELTGSLDYRT